MNILTPKCRECQWCVPIAGNTHVSCKSPIAETLWKLPFDQALEVISQNMPLTVAVVIEGEVLPAVLFNTAAVEKGYASWPYNFDPVWAEFCIVWQIERMNSNA